MFPNKKFARCLFTLRLHFYFLIIWRMLQGHLSSDDLCYFNHIMESNEQESLEWDPELNKKKVYWDCLNWRHAQIQKRRPCRARYCFKRSTSIPTNELNSSNTLYNMVILVNPILKIRKQAQWLANLSWVIWPPRCSAGCETGSLSLNLHPNHCPILPTSFSFFFFFLNRIP